MRALIVGLGGIGQRHARNLRAILGNDLDLVAYRARGLTHVITEALEVDGSRDVERELSIRVFSDLESALEQRPSVAFICNPSSLHVPTAMACVRQGCDLFIEKPLAANLDGVDELIHAADLAQRIVMVGYQLRFHPCVQTLASVLESGVLGNLLAVRAAVGEFLPGFHPYEDYRASYASKASLGGGVVLTQIHEFDYLDALFGPIASVYALGGHWSNLEVDVEDVASTLIEAVTGGRPLPIHLQQDYLQKPPFRQCEVVGDRGKALADFRALRVTVWRHDGPPIEHAFEGFDRNKMFVDEVEHFLRCVATRVRPLVDLRGGVRSLTIALAARQSMASGTVVNVSQDSVVSVHRR